MTAKSDAELVALARTGNKEAFGELARRYQVLADRFALRLVRDHFAASEIVQEAMLQAYLSLEHLRDPARFRSWLCGIMLNVHRSRLRQLSSPAYPAPLGDLDEVQVQASEAFSPEALSEHNELSLAVAGAMGALSQAHHRVLTLFYFQDFSIAGIAAALHLSENAVKVRLHRARRELRRIIESQRPEIVPLTAEVRLSRRKNMVKVVIADVVKQERKDADGKPYTMYVIILKDEVGERALPIWIGLAEGQAIASGMTKFSMPRPMTFDLMAKLIEAENISVEHVRVEALKEDTFYAVIRLHVGEESKEVDARPSDALALAVRLGCPMFASEAVLQQAAIVIPPGAPEGGAGIRGIVKELEGIRERFKLPWMDKQQGRKAHEDLITDLFKQK